MPQINNPVLHNHKVAFFCIPKCANSSTKQTIRLALRPDIFDVPERDIEKVIKTHGEPFVYKDKYAIREYRDKGYLTICLVRNPYERTISTWAHKITHNPNGKIQWSNLGFWAGMTFEEYVDHINKIPDEEADIHFQSQSHLISINNELVPEYIFHFEDLPQAWQDIKSKVYNFCGLHLNNLPKFNSSDKTKRPSLNNFPRIKEMIYYRYFDNFRLLRYKK